MIVYNGKDGSYLVTARRVGELGRLNRSLTWRVMTWDKPSTFWIDKLQISRVFPL